MPESRGFSVTLSELEAGLHVADSDMVVEIPSAQIPRGPGDDDLSRQQRTATSAGG